MSSLVGMPKECSETPHAHIYLTTIAGVAPQRGEEAFGGRCDLMSHHELDSIRHCGHCKKQAGQLRISQHQLDAQASSITQLLQVQFSTWQYVLHISKHSSCTVQQHAEIDCKSNFARSQSQCNVKIMAALPLTEVLNCTSPSKTGRQCY